MDLKPTRPCCISDSTMALGFVQLIMLFFTFAFGAISGSIGALLTYSLVIQVLLTHVDALSPGASVEAKSHRDENRLEGLVPARFVIDVNVGGPFHI